MNNQEFAMMMTIVYFVVFIVSCVLFYYTLVYLFNGIKFFRNKNEKHSIEAQYQEILEPYYQGLKGDELVIFYKAFSQTLDIVRFAPSEDFLVVFLHCIKTENGEIYHRLKDIKPIKSEKEKMIEQLRGDYKEFGLSSALSRLAKEAKMDEDELLELYKNSREAFFINSSPVRFVPEVLEKILKNKKGD